MSTASLSTPFRLPMSLVGGGPLLGSIWGLGSCPLIDLFSGGKFGFMFPVILGGCTLKDPGSIFGGGVLYTLGAELGFERGLGGCES